jgi:pimeloyl-ACP methyl ester carboxylesterase
MVHPDRLLDETWFDALLDMVARCPLERYEAQIHALLGRPDASDVLDRVRCPSLILCGRDDAWSPLEQHLEMAERVAGSRSVSVETVVIEHCGHMATVERPEAVTEALSHWLSDSGEGKH